MISEGMLGKIPLQHHIQEGDVNLRVQGASAVRSMSVGVRGGPEAWPVQNGGAARGMGWMHGAAAALDTPPKRAKDQGWSGALWEEPLTSCNPPFGLAFVSLSLTHYVTKQI